MSSVENQSWYYSTENKPQRPPMSPKTKKILTYTLCAVIGIAIAIGLVVLFNTVFTGANTPQEAAVKYLEASILYDIDGMIKYSSDYNKTVLYGNQETSDRLLRSTLTTAYKDIQQGYTADQLDFKLLSVTEFTKGEAKFDQIMEKYIEKDADAKDTVEKFAVVELVVTKGTTTTTTKYLAVKCGIRWYYGYAGA